jgi:hypothetical protein
VETGEDWSGGRLIPPRVNALAAMLKSCVS